MFEQLKRRKDKEPEKVMLRPDLRQVTDQQVTTLLTMLYERYAVVVAESELADTTKVTYLTHASNFVRWVKGEFEPGATLESDA